MEITDTERDSRYENATPTQKQLYSSSEAGASLSAIAQKYDLSSADIYRKFAITVGDFILGFYRSEDFALVLEQNVGLSTQMSALVAVDVKEFLSPLITATTDNVPLPNSVTSGIAQPQQENVYTSTQAAILTEKPTGNFSAGAKWESEN
ncbi:MAG: hypothetical protein R3B53_00630 [Candidatus Paceibacterota bacterium]